MTANGLQPISFDTIQRRTFERLREAIYSGKFKPGDALRELHLCRELQVSQAPVREALLQLEQIGLVVRETHRGTRVTRLSGQEIRERLATRVPLERLAWIEAANRLTEKGRTELKDRLGELSRAVLANDYISCTHADMAFHKSIWLQSGNYVLCHVLEQLTVPLYAFVSLVFSARAQHLRDVVVSHEEILEALSSKSVKRINETVDRHILRGFYQSFLESGVEDLQKWSEDAAHHSS